MRSNALSHNAAADPSLSNAQLGPTCQLPAVSALRHRRDAPAAIVIASRNRACTAPTFANDSTVIDGDKSCPQPDEPDHELADRLDGLLADRQA
jgi:hypothetical protein